MSENARGALYMALCMVAFTLNDALVKRLAMDLPLFQVVFLRGMVATVVLLAIATAMGAWRVRPARGDAFWVGLRSVAEIGAMVPFFIAITNMPLATVSAILQVLPLSVTLAAALFLGERVGWRRWSAIGIGFFGVLLIIRPGMEGFSVYALFALATVLAVTVRDIVTRRISVALPSILVAAAMSVAVTLAAFVLSLAEPWQAIPLALAWYLISAVGVIIVAYLLSVLSMRHGDVGAVAPFRYTALLSALVLGWLFFGEWPDALTLVGAALVVGSGLFTLWRGRQVASAQPSSTGRMSRGMAKPGR